MRKRSKRRWKRVVLVDRAGGKFSGADGQLKRLRAETERAARRKVSVAVSCGKDQVTQPFERLRGHRSGWKPQIWGQLRSRHDPRNFIAVDASSRTGTQGVYARETRHRSSSVVRVCLKPVARVRRNRAGDFLQHLPSLKTETSAISPRISLVAGPHAGTAACGAPGEFREVAGSQ
jgi:hypothetical protein